MPRQQLEDVLSPTNDDQSFAGWDDLPKGKAKEATAAEDHLLPQVPDKFRVHDEKTANWVVRKVVEARSYAKRAKEWAEREVMRAERDEQFFLSRFGEQLTDWAKEQIKRGGKLKSVPLPAGRVGFRQEKFKIIVEDEQAVIEWARKNCPSAVVTAPKISKTALNDHFEKTGELPPKGVSTEPAGDKFYVR